VTQPVMLMLGGFSNRIYAVRRYRSLGDDKYVVVGDNKDDVIEQAIHNVVEHRQACVREECPCVYIEVRTRCGVIYPIPEPGQVVRACERTPRHSGEHADMENSW